MPDIFIAPKREVREEEVRSELTNPHPTSHPQPHPMNPLSAFADHPQGLHFATQAKDEEIELFLRKHFITNVPWMAGSLVLFLVPPILFPLLLPLVPFSIPPSLTAVLLAFWYLVVLGMLILTSFINWYFNVYIVTNERVIDVDFISLLYREISATRLNLVQDVTVKTGGAIQSIFRYGDVFIQTAGTEVNFDFHAVPHPEAVANRIEQLMRQARASEGKSSLEEALKK